MSKSKVVNRLKIFKLYHIKLKYKLGKLWACKFLSFLLTLDNDPFRDV